MATLSSTTSTAVPTTHSTTKTRWGAIDALKILAAFGVILIHIGVIFDNQLSTPVSVLQKLFSWVVPYFLVTSFFFAARGELRVQAKTISWKEFLISKASRLLVPFALWGIIYTGARVALSLKAHDTAKVKEIFQDPVGLLFSGGAMMLYFLPLLFIGLVELRLIAPWLKRLSQSTLTSLFAATALCAWVLLVSKNGYNIGANRGFETLTLSLTARFGGINLNNIAPIRILLVVLADMIFCLHLIVFAFLAARSIYTKDGRYHLNGQTALLAFAGITLALQLVAPFWSALSNIPVLYSFAGMSMFVLGLASLNTIPSTPAITTLGLYTFGIYLVHQLVLELIKPLGHRLGSPANLVSALGLTAIAFLVSYGLTALAARMGNFPRLLFALDPPGKGG